ncbi:MAG: hypothetical protein HC767_15190 [Akkermansiaceae bacterium]|nr:hypothetical protein [Akkermansiaceae bacterium]
MQAGHMNGFFKLIQHLSTQGEPAFCGIASLCVVLNAMEIDPRHVLPVSKSQDYALLPETSIPCCLAARREQHFAGLVVTSSMMESGIRR